MCDGSSLPGTGFQIGNLRYHHFHLTEIKIKNQKQVLKLFPALVIIISIQRNEQNGRFKHWIYSNMVLNMLSSLQDPIGVNT